MLKVKKNLRSSLPSFLICKSFSNFLAVPVWLKYHLEGHSLSPKIAQSMCRQLLILRNVFFWYKKKSFLPPLISHHWSYFCSLEEKTQNNSKNDKSSPSYTHALQVLLVRVPARNRWLRPTESGGQGSRACSCSVDQPRGAMSRWRGWRMDMEEQEDISPGVFSPLK